jgi:hypothetical protein
LKARVAVLILDCSKLAITLIDPTKRRKVVSSEIGDFSGYREWLEMMIWPWKASNISAGSAAPLK